MIETVGIVIGILGLIPIMLDYEKITEKIKFFASKDGVVQESLHILFDIESKEKIDVYHTSKLKIKTPSPRLILGYQLKTGDCVNRTLKIDNVKIDNKYVETENNLNLLYYTMFNKSKGDTAVYQENYTLTMDSLDDLLTENLWYLIEHHKCKKLTFQIIFPKDFMPTQLEYYNQKGESSIIKSSFDNVSKQLCEVADKRRQVIWDINYPRFKYKYGIKWNWKAIE